MISQVADPIAAIASPPGPAARGIIRLSGPTIDRALKNCFSISGPRTKQLSELSGCCVIRGTMKLAEPIGSIAAELFYWPNESSYTRQRSAEIQCSGSQPVLDAIMDLLASEGVRKAHPGEFTLRAFLAGRVDLTRAEAVLGVIDSRSEQEMAVALRQLAGGLSGPVEEVYSELMNLLADLEAGLDFVEDDIEFISNAAVVHSLQKCESRLQQIQNQIRQRNLHQSSMRIVLYGLPNSGKSCLLNALTESSTAIVSQVAGTTRDYLIGRLNIDGIPIELIDTAGHTSSPAEMESSEARIQSRAQVLGGLMNEQAHLRMLCLDGTKPLEDWEQQQIEKAQENPNGTLIIQTKTDQPSIWSDDRAIGVSSLTGDGLPTLRQRIRQSLTQSLTSGQMVTATASRCRETLINAIEDVTRTKVLAESQAGDEIVAAAVRGILDNLSVVTGRVYTEDILDRVFSRFCIGK